MKKLVKIILKVLVYGISGLLVILIAGTSILHLPVIQNKLAQWVASEIKSKSGAEVSVGRIAVTLPYRIGIENVYAIDNEGDTLIKAGDLAISFNLFQLARRKIVLNTINVKDAGIHLKRYKNDSTYNFSQFSHAFGSSVKDTKRNTGGSAKKFSLLIKKIRLENIRFLFQDHINSNRYNTVLGSLRIRIHSLDPENNLIDLSSVRIANSSFSVTINSSQEKEPEPLHLNLRLRRNLQLGNVNIQFTDNVSQQEISADNIHLKVIPRELNLPEHKIDLQKIQLTGTRLKIHKKSVPEIDTSTIKKSGAENPANPFQWNIVLNELVLKSNSFGYADDNKAVQNSGIDFTHLAVKDVNGNLDGIHVAHHRLATNISRLSLSEKSGFILDGLTASVRFSENSAELRGLILQTPNSTIKNSTIFSYASVDQLQHQPQDIAVKMQITESKIGMADILFFRPGLQKKNRFFSGRDRIVSVDGSIEGKVNDILIDHIRAGVDSTVIEARGTIQGLPGIRTTFFNVEVDTFRTTGHNILAILGDSLVPGSITLPPQLSINGKFNGTTRIFRASAGLRSTFGKILMNASITADTLPGKRRFHTGFDLKNFNAGKIFSNAMIGLITLKTMAEGTIPEDSLPEYADACFNVHAGRLQLSGYDYTDFDVSGKYIDHKLSASAAFSDTNMVCKLTASADFSDTLPAYALHLNLTGADLQALNLTSQDISIRGKLDAALRGKDMNDLSGDAEVSGMLLVKNGRQYRLDSVEASLENKPGYTKLSLASLPARLDYSGSVKIDELGSVMKSYINRYFYLDDTNQQVVSASENFSLYLKIFNTELLTDVIWPDLNGLLPATVEGNYNAASHSLNIDADFPYIDYNHRVIDSLKIAIHSTDTSSISYSIKCQRISVPPFTIEKTTLEGTLADNSFFFSVKMLNNDKPDRLAFMGKALRHDKEFSIHIEPDPLIINYTHFSLPEDNAIIIGRHNVQFTDIDLRSDSQRIVVSQVSNSTTLPDYQITFSGFKISNFTGMLEAEQNIVGGTLEGEIILAADKNGSKFRSDLMLHDVVIYNDTAFSSIAIKANSMNNGVLDIESEFQGRKNNLTISGSLGTTGSQNRLNLTVEIRNVDLEYIAPFVKKQFNEFDGDLGGQVSIKGTVKDPDVTGELNLTNTTITPTFLGTRIRIPDDKVKLRNRELIFNHFSILDNLENKATIDGKLSFTRLDVPEFDIRFRASDFRFLNSTYNDNSLYYGKLIADLDAEITGTAMNPVVDLDARVKNGSVFHLIVPALNTPSIEKEGIVRFVDRKDTSGNRIIERSLENNGMSTMNNLAADLTANVEIDNGTRIYIMVDPSSNEELYVNGKANLSLSMKGGGTPNLTGRFEIEEGTYSLTLYDVIRRKFTIKEGSYLQWNGNIMNPKTDITTVYKVITSPWPLIADETTQLTGQDNSRYSENMPFNVELNISGYLLEPVLNFDLNVPQGQSNALVEAKLARLNKDETELNKQVFSLLLFNSFMQGTTSANRPVAYELNSTARSSVSRILTQQLNSFAERYIKGFNVNIAVNSYYLSAGKQSGGKTDVSLDISRELFNKRLNVQVGGDINVEGSQQKTPYDFNSIAGDVAIEYKIDKSGTYRLRGFSKSEYEDVIDGEVNATGISFIFNKDFYRLGNLLKSDTTKTNPKR